MKNKKALQSNANCPLTGRCPGYIVNKYEHVGEGGLQRAPGGVNKFEHVSGESHMTCD